MLLVEITTEKEKKLRIGMQMMGLSASAYWIVWVLTAIVLSILISGLLIGTGYLCKFAFFTKTSLAVTSLVRKTTYHNVIQRQKKKREKENTTYQFSPSPHQFHPPLSPPITSVVFLIYNVIINNGDVLFDVDQEIGDSANGGLRHHLGGLHFPRHFGVGVRLAGRHALLRRRQAVGGVFALGVDDLSAVQHGAGVWRHFGEKRRHARHHQRRHCCRSRLYVGRFVHVEKIAAHFWVIAFFLFFFVPFSLLILIISFVVLFDLD